MLINLRKFVSQENITDMLNDITFKKENDIFYNEIKRIDFFYFGSKNTWRFYNVFPPFRKLLTTL
jgi:hypothetical protein